MSQPPVPPVSPFHKGEQILQARAGKREAMEQIGHQVIRDYMPEQHRDFFAQLPFIVAGCVDDDGWPWASLIPGHAGFVHSPNARQLNIAQAAIHALTQKHDPLAKALTTVGRAIGLLGIELPTRRRNRVNTTVVATQAGTTLKVDQSFGNCPKYIQQRPLINTRKPYALGLNAAQPPAVFTTLDAAAQHLIQQADTFFVASCLPVNKNPINEGVDVSHRGGLPGFVRVDGNTLTIPDYSGNFFFNTLGNFLLNPKAGLVFPDFSTGDLLLLSGTVELLDEAHPEVLAFKGAERAWRLNVIKGVWLKDALPFRATEHQYAITTTTTGTWQQVLAEQAENNSHNRQQYPLDNWQPLKVVKIVDESHTIKSFYFEHTHGKALLPFKAGQYLALSVKIPSSEQRVTRTYTLSGAPHKNYYRVSVKREPHAGAGQPSVSQLMHDTLCVGDSVKAQTPQGHFILKAGDKRPAVLIAAGVGITPMVSMAEHIAYKGLATGKTRSLTVIHVARNIEQRAFADVFTQLQIQTADAIRYYSFLTQPTPNDSQNYNYHGTGRLNASILKSLLALDDYDFYVCGPSGFMQSSYDALRSLGVDDTRIYAEAFGPAAIKRTQPLGAEPTHDKVVQEADTALVTFSLAGIQQRWNKGDKTLLEVAQARGLEPPFSCRSGNCGACAIALEQGSVSYRQTPSVPIPKGQALLCCAVPAKGSTALMLKL